MTLGDFLGSTGRAVIPVGPQIDNVNGTLTYGGISYGTGAGPNGSGLLATITFQTRAAGTSNLPLSNIQLTDTDAKPIDFVSHDGRIVIGDCILADFDCDCDVDLADLMQVALRWGSQVGDPEYDPMYDLDGDGDIDIVDVALVAAAWGNTCDETVSVLAQRGPQAHVGSSLLSTGLRLEPATLEVPIGQPVTLNVWIDEAQSLGGFEFALDYDATLLTISEQDVALGDFVGSTGRTPTTMGPQITIDGDQGNLTFGAITLGWTPAGPSGSGMLAQLTFTPVRAGEAVLRLASAQVTSTSGESQEGLALQGATLSVQAADRSYVPLIER